MHDMLKIKVMVRNRCQKCVRSFMTWTAISMIAGGIWERWHKQHWRKKRLLQCWIKIKNFNCKIQIMWESSQLIKWIHGN